MGAPGPELRPGVSAVGPIITPEGHGPEGPPALDPKVQVVRFQGPLGLRVEVLAPEPSPVPIDDGEGEGIATVGLQRGVGYRLRLSNITERPGVELFPVIEVVGHLHRPREISPAKYPIRIVFTDEELWDVVDRGRLVTKVIYLEEPEQAIPLKVSKDQIPVVTLNPTEQPLKVAEALGRVMAIVRIGGRRPTLEEIKAGATGDLGLDAVAAVGAVHCPFTSTDGEPCQLPCGPVCGTPPPPGRPWLPRDEYLCDGGDQGEPAGVGEGGNIKGIDPRDAVMRFDIGLNDKPAAPRSANQPCLRLRPPVRRGPHQHGHERGGRGARSDDEPLARQVRADGKPLSFPPPGSEPGRRARARAEPRPGHGWPHLRRRGFQHARARRLPQRPAGQG